MKWGVVKQRKQACAKHNMHLPHFTKELTPSILNLKQREKGTGGKTRPTQIQGQGTPFQKLRILSYSYTNALLYFSTILLVKVQPTVHRHKHA